MLFRQYSRSGSGGRRQDLAGAAVVGTAVAMGAPCHRFARRVDDESELAVGFVRGRREIGAGDDDDIDFVVTPGLDTANFGSLPAGTVLGHTLPGGESPLIVIDDTGVDSTAALIQVDAAGAVTITRTVIPAMMTRTREQTRRDCLFYVLADLG